MAIFLTVAIIYFPNVVVEASKNGLHMWWEIVFPSLLPFFIVAEILISFGIVRFVGVLLEPLMRPLFNVSGAGAFAWAMGMVSGFPAGAKITARLYEDQQITKIEAERLISFTNNSNPLFIYGAVSVGFFANVKLGLLLAVSHYLGNLVVGIIMRFYKYNETKDFKRGKEDDNLFKVAFKELHSTRLKEKRTIGKILGDAVSNSIRTLLIIGGFIILFSVLNQILFALGMTKILASTLTLFFHMLSLPEALTLPLIAGLFEITQGAYLTSQVINVSLLHQAMIVSFVLAFSGFSVQAQVASILAEAKLPFKPFFIGRVIQACFSMFFCLLLFKPLYSNQATQTPPTDLPVSTMEPTNIWVNLFNELYILGPIITITALIIYCLILATNLKKSA